MNEFRQTLIPRVPFTAAETVVDFARIDDYIVAQRARLEQRIAPATRRYADSVILNRGIPGMAQLRRLEETLTSGLARTFVFGYRQAEAEIRRLRDLRGERPYLIAAADRPPAQSWDVTRYCQRIARERGHAFNADCVAWYGRLGEGKPDEFRDRARRAAHNMVLDVVGQIHNAGRSLAATGGSRPVIAARVAATRWAMRSEQLDTNTCDYCDGAHGDVYEVASPAYFTHMPPAGCRGGGRCRGIYVYADDPDDFARPSRLF